MPLLFILLLLLLLLLIIADAERDMSDDDLEHATLAYGREIFARVNRQAPCVHAGLGRSALMDWTMSDEAVKVQLFRFIDALPRLHDPAADRRPPARVLRRGRRRRAAVAALRRAAAARERLRRPAAGAGGQAERRAPGPPVHRRLEPRRGRSTPSRDLRRQSLAFTVDLLGEATITEAEAERYQQRVPAT